MKSLALQIVKPAGDADDVMVLEFRFLQDEYYLHVFVAPDRLSQFHYAIEQFRAGSGATTTTFLFGSFDPTDAGGAMDICFRRVGNDAQIFIRAIAEEEKATRECREYRGQAGKTVLEKFSLQIRHLAAAVSGTATFEVEAA